MPQYPRDFVPLFGSNVQASVEYYADMYDKRGEWDIAEMTRRVDELKIQLYKERSRGGMDAFAGVRELAAVAHEAGVAVGIGSSGTPEKIAHNLRAAGLADVFPDERLIVSATHVARGKPAPDVYVEVLARLAADATAAGRPMDDSKPAIVVEDAVRARTRGAGACPACARTHDGLADARRVVALCVFIRCARARDWARGAGARAASCQGRWGDRGGGAQYAASGSTRATRRLRGRLCSDDKPLQAHQVRAGRRVRAPVCPVLVQVARPCRGVGREAAAHLVLTPVDPAAAVAHTQRMGTTCLTKANVCTVRSYKKPNVFSGDTAPPCSTARAGAPQSQARPRRLLTTQSRIGRPSLSITGSAPWSFARSHRVGKSPSM